MRNDFEGLRVMGAITSTCFDDQMNKQREPLNHYHIPKMIRNCMTMVAVHGGREICRQSHSNSRQGEGDRVGSQSNAFV